MPRPARPSRAASAPAASADARYGTLIATADLARHLGDPAFVIVDVRHDLAKPERFGEDAYAQSHVPGAVFGRLGIDATKHVVVYDQGSGIYASRLWWMLRWLGHDNVAVLDGGFAKWMREGRPVSTDVPHVAPAKF